LGHSRNRMLEFERVMGMGRYQNIPMEICSNDDLKAHYPFLETHDLEGGLYDPTDGDIDPAQLTQALAKGARQMGGKILRFCPATGARRENGEWVIETEKGEIRCEYVVNAAGYRAQQVGQWFGRYVPMVAMSHQYVLTEPVAELEAWTAENGRKLPLLRDVDSSYYLRQEKTGFNIGPYERNCKAHWITPDDPMPDDFSFQLWADDLDRIEWYVTDAMERVPLVGTSGVSKIINGPIPYTPDGLPLIGPMPGVPNAFEACVFTFGITQGGGAGKVLAEWITEGGTEWDMWSCDPRRFTGFVDQAYTTAKGMEVYGHEYAMHYPRHFWPAARDQRLSAVDKQVRALGGQMGYYNGWERAAWFAQDGDDTSIEATETWEREGPWQKRVAEEVGGVRDDAGILDLPGFSRYHVTGEGAAAWLRTLVTGVIAKPGRIGLLYFADDKGRTVTEMSIIRFAEDDFMLITAATAQWHDLAWLERHLPEGSGITITDRTEDMGTFIVAGPKSRDHLAPLTDADLTQGWLTHQNATIAGKNALLIRVSFTGELGWEIHAAPADQPAIYDALIGAGLKPFGMFALDSMRIEKGYRAWKGDLSTDYSLLEAGLDRFVKLERNDDFLGKEALVAQREAGLAKRFAMMTIDIGDYDAPYMSTVWKGEEIVGEITSGAMGYRTNKFVALSVIRTDCGEPGTALEVEVFGERRAAVVTGDEALWDPQNERLRA
ncbi:MAG: FAD-dependent oxidoreductase, partial [Pseudomonadota bacterium]|nr:FAD-dependent oxidoreductase [Pseudomonadota bacterium]